jgi:hypothetical protein
VQQLIIGVPARNESATITELAEALELGAAGLGETTRCELVLAYQDGGDDTLGRWESRTWHLPQRVLADSAGAAGKGRNVKLLIRHALDAGAHLLLVDADLRRYPPANVSRFARTTDPLKSTGLVLPLWNRPRGQGNSTDFLACPWLFATFGARIRQPLAGQMLLSHRLLSALDVDGLPNEYGIDVALTIHALDADLPVSQVAVSFPSHEGGANSHRIMGDVATILLRRSAAGEATAPFRDRGDVTWPEKWWTAQPDPPAETRSLRGLINELTSEETPNRWTAAFEARPDAVRDLWCDHLATAIRGARTGRPIAPLVEQLTLPFLVHAEYRRRLEIDRLDAESYISELSDHLAEALA